MGPTSTGTYPVNDNPFEWLGSTTEIGNVGYGIAIGLYFGFVFTLTLQKIRRRKSLSLAKKRTN